MLLFPLKEFYLTGLLATIAPNETFQSLPNCTEHYVLEYEGEIIWRARSYEWKNHYCNTYKRQGIECGNSIPACTCDSQMLSINCENLRLISSPASVYKNTRFCTLKGNRLNENWTNYTLSGYDLLEYLNLDDNDITTLEPFTFQYFNFLAILEISYNKIRRLESNVFAGLIVLHDLIFVSNQLTELPDNVFENLTILQNLQLGSNRITHIAASSFKGLRQLQILSLRNNHLTTITSNVFQHLSSLKVLDLAANQIRTVQIGAFDKLESLRYIDLSNNELTILKSFTFQYLPSFRWLNVRYNQINRIEDNFCSDKTALHEIYLTHNDLRTVRFSVFRNLPITCMYLNRNRIRHIESDLSVHTDLMKFDISENQLTNLQRMFVSTNLLILNVSGNQITIVEDNAFDKLPNLEVLDLSRNNLKTFKWNIIRNLTRLMILHVHHSNIVDIEQNGRVVIPKFLDFSYNNLIILKISSVEDPIEMYSNRVRSSMNFSHNQIEHIAEGTFDSLNGHTIDLRHNNLVTLKSNTFRMRDASYNTIWLDNNRIECIENGAFQLIGSNGYINLHISYNNLAMVKSHFFTENVTKLSAKLTFDHNPIETIERNTFNRHYIDVLHLEHMKLKILTSEIFRDMGNVLDLHLQDNQIAAIENYTFHQECFKRTMLVQLQRNKITIISSYVFQIMTRLMILHLESNRIEIIEDHAFYGLTTLRHLYLHDNRLTSIKPNLFKSLVSLERLNLQNNLIEFIDDHSFSDLHGLRFLDLHNNKLSQLNDRTFIGLERLSFLYIENNRINEIQRYVFRENTRLIQLQTDEFRICCLAQHVNCTPLPDEFSSCDDLMKKFTLVISIWVIGIVAIITNIYVIIYRTSAQTTPIAKIHSFLIRNLAVSDLLMGVYLIIIAVADVYTRGEYFIHAYKWRSSYICDFAGFLSTFASESTVFTLTVITFDRLFGVVFPFRIRQRSINTARWLTAAGWIFAAIIALIPLPVFGVGYFYFYGRSGVCLPLHLTTDTPNGWQYSVFVFIFLNAAAFTMIAIGYLLMFLFATTNQSITSTRDRTRQRTMAFRMTLLVLADAACWLPIIVLGIRSLFGYSTQPDVYVWIAVFILPLNAALNPVLYTISHLINIGLRNPFYVIETHEHHS